MLPKTQLLEALICLQDLSALLDRTCKLLEEESPGVAEVGYWTAKDKAVQRRAKALVAMIPTLRGATPR